MMKTNVNIGYLVFLSFVAALGGFLFGYDNAVISGTIAQVTALFHLDALQQGWYVGCALIGSIAGVLLAGVLSDRFGRKLTMILSAVLFSTSAIGCAVCTDFDELVLYRIIGGVGIGVVSIISPLYISEVSVAQYRGRLVSLYQLAVTVGFLGAYLVNFQLLGYSESHVASGTGLFEKLFISEVWRGMLGMETLPALLFFAVIFFIPESPRWLAMKGKREKAWSVLSRIGGNRYAERELQMVEQTSASKSEGGLKLLFSRPFRKVLVLGVIVAVFQQWCGTNVIFNYAQEIFQSAGYSLGDVLFNIVVTGVANVIFTFVAIYTVERLGRRALMLLGAGGLAGIYLVLGACYFFQVSGFFMVVLVVLAIACYAMSLGPITWVLLAEIFPNRVRGVAMATCTFALWVGSFTLTYTFPLLNTALGSYGTFWIYSAICVFGFLFFQRALPETKGKSLETLEKDLIK